MVILSDFNKPVVADASQSRFAFADMALAKSIGEALLGAYPNRAWTIHADSEQGVVDVMLADATTRYGYTIHLKAKTLFELQREAVYGGGEILERFNLSRERVFNRDAVDELKRNVLGEAVAA